jgi:hypothetical protein
MYVARTVDHMHFPAFLHVDSWDPHECTAVGCIPVPRTLQDLTLLYATQVDVSKA